MITEEIRILILSPALFAEDFKKMNCEVVWITKRRHIFQKILNHIPLLNMGAAQLDLEKLKCHAETDVAIVFDSALMLGKACKHTPKDLMDNVNNVLKAKRKIFFYWNTIKNAPFEIPSDWEIWTFDIGDAKKYGYKYSSTFYPMKRIDSLFCKCNNKICYDLFFAGLDKGRKAYLENLKSRLFRYNIKTKLYFISHSIWNILFGSAHKTLSYEKLTALTNKSKAILEIAKADQKGLTLRTMEALCLQKKLLTNNKYIYNYKLYNPDNVFILGVDQEERLNEFLETPYKELSFDKNVYEIGRWLKRLIENKPLCINEETII